MSSIEMNSFEGRIKDTMVGRSICDPDRERGYDAGYANGAADMRQAASLVGAEADREVQRLTVRMCSAESRVAELAREHNAVRDAVLGLAADHMATLSTADLVSLLGSIIGKAGAR